MNFLQRLERWLSHRRASKIWRKHGWNERDLQRFLKVWDHMHGWEEVQR